MKLQDLRNDCLLVIIEFLTFTEIASLRKICKYFKTFVSKNHTFIQNLFTSRNFIESSKGLNSWDRICEEMISSTEPKKFYPYYTNGGTYQDLPDYFIQNLVNGRVYSSIVNTNNLVKYCYTNYQFGSDFNPLNHKVSENVFFIKDIEESLKIYTKEMPLLQSVKFNSPQSGFGCPVSTLMVFSSVEKEEDLDLFELFYDTFEVNQVVEIAKILKLDPIVEKSAEVIKVTFDRKEPGIAPLLWVKINSIYARRKHSFWENFRKSLFARYFYLLIIKGEYLEGGPGIDCGDVTPVFRVIRVRD